MKHFDIVSMMLNRPPGHIHKVLIGIEHNLLHLYHFTLTQQDPRAYQNLYYFLKGSTLKQDELF